jgi:acyl carrier protein
MRPTPTQICTQLISIVSTKIEGWGLEDIELGEKTRLSEDLCFSSIDLLNFLAAVDVQFGRKLPYEHLLMSGDRYRTELTISELVEFVYENFDASPPPVKAM